MRILLLSLMLAAGLPQSPAEPSPPDPKALIGVWEGTLTRVQAGRCSLGGREKTVDNVQVVIDVDENGAVAAGWTRLPSPVKARPTVAIRVDKARLFFDVPITAQCGPNFRRKYVVKYEIGASIEPDGRRMLRLVGSDVPCITSGCRFQSVYELEFRGVPPG
jgi:hypothetical protein